MVFLLALLENLCVQLGLFHLVHPYKREERKLKYIFSKSLCAHLLSVVAGVSLGTLWAHSSRLSWFPSLTRCPLLSTVTTPSLGTSCTNKTLRNDGGGDTALMVGTVQYSLFDIPGILEVHQLQLVLWVRHFPLKNIEILNHYETNWLCVPDLRQVLVVLDVLTVLVDPKQSFNPLLNTRQLRKDRTLCPSGPFDPGSPVSPLGPDGPPTPGEPGVPATPDSPWITIHQHQLVLMFQQLTLSPDGPSGPFGPGDPCGPASPAGP